MVSKRIPLHIMDVATMLRAVRRRRSLSLRQLGQRAHTSHATLAAYEAGRGAPTADTLDRVLRAAGFEAEPALVMALPEHATRGQELLDVLELAEQFPARHDATLRAPRFGRS